jgi:hypothetical protein
MKTLRNALLMTAVAVLGYQDTSAAAAAESSAARRTITIAAGTPLSVQLGSAVSSATSRIEQPVSGTLRRAIVVNGRTIVPAGAGVSGYVSQLQRPGRVKGRALIGVRFTRIHIGDTRYTIQTPSISRRAPATKKADATKIGIGAGAGALVGALTGGKKGAAIGSGVGAAGGSAVVLSTRGKHVALGRGAVLSTRLSAPLTIRER